MTYIPPCHERDDWFVPDNRGGNRKGLPEGDPRLEENVSISIRAKLTCLTRCKMRQECMEKALRYESDEMHPLRREGETAGAAQSHRWGIWGGYSAQERTRLARSGPLKPTPQAAAKRAPALAAEFVDYHLLRSEAAERWGLTERSVESLLHRYIWDLRIEQGDPWVMARTESPGRNDVRKRNSTEEPLRTVRAA